MEINELPSPHFIVNEAGMISVFLPAFTGEPKNPVLSKKDDKTLHFQRSADGDLLLTGIDEEIMAALAQVKKILIIETNVMKSIDMIDKSLTSYLKQGGDKPEEGDQDIMDLVERAYEAEVRF